MIKKAIKLIEQGKYIEAEGILREEIANEPTNAEAMFHLALARREQADIGEAMDLLRDAIRVQPRNATLYFALGNMQLAVEDYDEAEKNFLKSAGLDPNNVDARNGLAFIEIRQSRFQAAEHSLRIALNIDPDNLQALIFIGIALLEQEQHDVAIEYLQRAVTLNPENVQAQFCLGRALLASGNSGFAVQCFENAVEGEPQTAEFRDWLACAQLNTGAIREAKENFYRALDMGRVNIEILMGLVKVETLLGNTADALGTMGQAVQFAPERHDLAMQYAEMLLESDRFDEAVSQLQSLQATGFSPEQVTIRLATALMQKGEAGLALSTLKPLKSNEDMSPESRLMLTWALQECDDVKGAAGQLEVLLAMEKPLPDAVLFRARQMYDAGDDQCLELLQQLLERDDIDERQVRQAHILLAHSLDRVGQFDNAVEEYTGLANRQAVVAQIAEQINQGPRALEGSGESPVSAMDTTLTADWPKQPPGDNRGDPSFVCAWPGSGRRRLFTALGQHSGLYYLGDDPSQQNDRRARLTDRVGANALGGLDESNIRMSRRHYWKATGLDKQLAADLNVIDTQWLIVDMLPTIARYFPGTSVLVLTREPRDMVIAWMQTGYQDLESLAALYQSQLEMLQKCRESLPLNFIEVDYDDLLANPEEGLQSIQQAMGLEPEDKVVENFKAAISRIPAKSGDWENYTGSLADVFGKFS
jgi:tetratricopeptide (TPR) repeat protein